jgi:hypothetical protein
MLTMHKHVEIGMTYRTDNAQNTQGIFPMNTFAGIANFYLGKDFCVGYVYETAANQRIAAARTTNEFFLRYKFK